MMDPHQAAQLTFSIRYSQQWLAYWSHTTDSLFTTMSLHKAQRTRFHQAQAIFVETQWMECRKRKYMIAEKLQRLQQQEEAAVKELQSNPPLYKYYLTLIH